MSRKLIPTEDQKEIVLLERLSSDFGQLYMSENYSDVTFVVDDIKIPSLYLRMRNKKIFYEKFLILPNLLIRTGHKVVLAAR